MQASLRQEGGWRGRKKAARRWTPRAPSPLGAPRPSAGTGSGGWRCCFLGVVLLLYVSPARQLRPDVAGGQRQARRGRPPAGREQAAARTQGGAAGSRPRSSARRAASAWSRPGERAYVVKGLPRAPLSRSPATGAGRPCRTPAACEPRGRVGQWRRAASAAAAAAARSRWPRARSVPNAASAIAGSHAYGASGTAATARARHQSVPSLVEGSRARRVVNLPPRRLRSSPRCGRGRSSSAMRCDVRVRLGAAAGRPPTAGPRSRTPAAVSPRLRRRRRRPGAADDDLLLLDRHLDRPVAGPVLGVDGVVLHGGVEPQAVALLAVVEGALERLAAARGRRGAAPPRPPRGGAAAGLRRRRRRSSSSSPSSSSSASSSSASGLGRLELGGDQRVVLGAEVDLLVEVGARAPSVVLARRARGPARA